MTDGTRRAEPLPRVAAGKVRVQYSFFYLLDSFGGSFPGGKTEGDARRSTCLSA